MRPFPALLLALGLGAAASSQALAQEPEYKTGMIVSPHIYLPQKQDQAGQNADSQDAKSPELTGMVFLVSGGKGWGEAEETEAKEIVDSGAAVVGIDFPSYMQSLAADDGDCIYMISDIEDISQQIQRRIGNRDYRHPILAGAGEGGALVLAMIAQSPLATIGGAVAVDPVEGVPLKKQLCTPADKRPTDTGIVYGLTDGALPAPVTIAFTPDADQTGKTHGLALKQAHADITVKETSDDAQDYLSTWLEGQLSADRSQGDLGLPLSVLEAKPAMDTMAIIYSGDGGWRDLDSEVGGYLQSQGMPTVGVDSLRYFWTKRTPEETSEDLKRIIDTYTDKWGVSNVVLIGYSFGADILPAAYNMLPKATKRRVKQISLMALSPQVDYEVSVTGWLGMAGDGEGGKTVDDIVKIRSNLVQCIYGTDEDDDPCPTLKAKGVESVPIDGGHHFDEDYAALGKRILDSLQTRLPK
ncbi:Type IV secretory pathway, VirJ component [Rhizobium sp. NFR07]|uniref:virulence factor family protein n=1 Tax=Rhizobium sp. NFR07 TaxID=1566262 RepID=UPI0008EDEBDC|nr:AcvB/VirJ family lysyl-phosphatidylglycerol hydrolase [Rhizobium sp. NFR07]SFB27199.1 Type IV secretory pathway, VirJ component [Rhizobium sp. NFR07]